MPDAFEGRVAALEGSAVVGSRPLGGGCLFDVRRIDLADGRTVVLKTGASDVPDQMPLEARMLADLRTAGAPVPSVLHVEPDLLVLEWVEHDGSALSNEGRLELAGALAALHDRPAPYFGYAYDTVIGRLPQSNTWTATWLSFFRDHRLLAQSRAALRARTLEPEIGRAIERLADHLDRWLVEPAHPSLLHGDLWTGNLLTFGGRQVAWIDPAVSFGNPEIELAFGTLFGPFDAGVLAAYGERRALAPDFWPNRRAIYLLYPLLVHRRSFGSSYARPLAEILASLGYRP